MGFFLFHKFSNLPPPPSQLLLVFFVCLEFQIIRFGISTFTPIFFIEISFVLRPPQVLTALPPSAWTSLDLATNTATKVGII